MLMICRLTAVTLIVAAVFFLLFTVVNVGATDGSLATLENQLSDLIYRTSRSIVTMESIRTPRSGSATVENDETLQSLISSGIIFDSSGNILVAASSVINRDKLLVHFDNQAIPVRLVGIDYLTGLALVSAGKSLGNPVYLSSHHGCAGQLVVALGNAYGVRVSPTLGFCAGMRPDGSIQFSAMITSGTIGGGLFDLSGKLVGLITGGIGHDQWAEVGLAVPSTELIKIFKHLIKRGDRQAGYIGITSADIEITPGIEVTLPAHLVHSESQRYFIVDKAVMVTNVVPLSPAANAGLIKGDMLISLNGESLTSVVTLKSFVRHCQPGSVIDIGFVRNKMPYVAPLQVGKLKLSMFNSFQDLCESQPLQTSAHKSLQKEIDSLKITLQALEKRLQNLR